MLSRRSRPSFPTVISLLALFIALGGTSYAALALPRNSVGAAQLKKGAVRSADVKNRSLRAVDFRRSALPVGPQGPPGAPGADGTVDAYARVTGDGTLRSKGDPSHPETARGVDQSDITRVSPGMYCIEDLPFLPASVMVASDSYGQELPPGNNYVLSATIDRGTGLGSCPPTAQVRVTSTRWSETAAPANADHSFFIWFEAG